MNCRHCQAPLRDVFLDLGAAPPSNAYMTRDALRAPEVHYPLRLFVCGTCRLVQTEDFTTADALFSDDYAYFSSTSKGWLAHAARYAAMVIDRLALGPASHVVELASNDGYLLRNFVEAGIPCLGIEPTNSTAVAAEALGIPVLQEFFGEAVGARLAAEGRQADLIAGNNVFAHVPDINDFTAGIAALLKPEGVVTLEFPHLMELVEHGQFDTVYHEHFSYLSLLSVARILAKAGLRIFDVEQIPTHGGSLRVWGCLDGAPHVERGAVAALLAEERARGMAGDDFYRGFQTRAETIKDDLLRFLLKARADGKTVAGYGAAAKGNTLLNFAGVRPDLLNFVCDAATAKQGKFLPGSRIPILAPAALSAAAPDYVLILPWNIAEEVMAQLDPLRASGTRFVTAVPELRVR
ncbi:class I SAM-dependent methyltransferase [Roseicyclus mahoneyensis]|uniref:Methyltransferase family protein n=1 Tax=Roseicyclus mahoneyensis TaxID=164332 RepID=A0A316GHK4_9RHOB|nr:class I SAM-dependent methyltransferase [Roseicyclus mahoneyensis]PWK59647.1 methyltransferase family protein [Roseicyclus mahoneyensis]